METSSMFETGITPTDTVRRRGFRTVSVVRVTTSARTAGGPATLDPELVAAVTGEFTASS